MLNGKKNLERLDGINKCLLDSLLIDLLIVIMLSYWIAKFLFLITGMNLAYLKKTGNQDVFIGFLKKESLIGTIKCIKEQLFYFNIYRSLKTSWSMQTQIDSKGIYQA